MKKIIVLAILTLISFCSVANSHFGNISRDGVDDTLKLIQGNIVVGFSWVDMPLNKILLLKHNEKYCAIKFISFERLGDEKKATTFRSSAETLLATYLKYEFGSLNEKIDVGKVTEHKLVSKVTFGIGRLTFGGGDKKIKCGEGHFYWEFPTGVFVNRKVAQLSFSPTTYTDFTNISDSLPTISWLHYEEERPKKIISINNKSDSK